MSAQRTPGPASGPTDDEIKQILMRSDLWDMHIHMGWYSAPEKAFKENSIKFAREIIARQNVGSLEVLDVLQTVVRQCGERLTEASGNTALLDHARHVIAKATGSA